MSSLCDTDNWFTNKHRRSLLGIMLDQNSKEGGKEGLFSFYYQSIYKVFL